MQNNRRDFPVSIAGGWSSSQNCRDGVLGPHSRLILTFALCGLVNFGSLGMLVGGLGAMVPERRREVTALGLRSILSGMIATG